MRRLPLTLAAMLVLHLVGPARAATLSVTPDKLTYHIGEVITLSVSGDAQGEMEFAVFGRLQYTGTGGVTPNTQTQKLVGTFWTAGIVGKGGGYSDAFNQIAGGSELPGNNLPANNPFSTITLIASAIGIVNVNWNTATGSGLELDFFGLMTAPGTGFCILGDTNSCPFVPEPTTGLLLILGLVGLAARRRARA